MLAGVRVTPEKLVGLVDGNDLLIGLEVGIDCAPLVSHPHPLSLACFRLGCFHIRQNNDTVKAVLVDVISRSLEASAATQHTLGCLAATLLPDEDLALIYFSIEGDDRELCQLG